MTNDIPASEVRVGAIVSVASPAGFAKGIWIHWKRIAKAIGVVQTRILMVFLYFLFVFPVGLIARRSGDPLHLKVPKDTNWTAHRQEEASLDTARRQF